MSGHKNAGPRVTGHTHTNLAWGQRVAVTSKLASVVGLPLACQRARVAVILPAGAHGAVRCGWGSPVWMVPSSVDGAARHAWGNPAHMG
eukprot:357527-Chlamydomonas_euryale.AAC.2